MRRGLDHWHGEVSWLRLTNRHDCPRQAGQIVSQSPTAMPGATRRWSASGIRWSTTLRTSGVSRAAMMYGRSQASKPRKNAVTRKPASARTNPILFQIGSIVIAWARNSRAPLAVPAWPTRNTPHNSRRRSLSQAPQNRPHGAQRYPHQGL